MTRRVTETREEFLSRCREYDRCRSVNPQFVKRKRSYMRDYRLKNLERELSRTRKWLLIPENRKRSIQKQMEYSKTPKARAARSAMIRRKMETNLNFRIKCALRSRIHSAIKGLNKSKRTMELIGCDVDFLRLHISAQFQDGMNWANWGSWHIDHIIPCAEFDLRQPEQQHKCFHFSNLRPLWMKENVTRHFIKT